MKRAFLLFCMLCLCMILQAQFTTSYFQVYRVLDAREQPISDSPFQGYPVMCQVGGSSYTGFLAYVNLGNLGNIQYSMTMDRTNDGYYVYAMPSIGGGYSLTDMWGNPFYLLCHPAGKEIIFATNNQIYFASSIGQSQYLQLTYDLIEKNPDFYRSIHPGIGGDGSSEDRASDRSNANQTCNHCYGSGKCSSCSGSGYMNNPFTGRNILCPSCEKNSNGVCKFCHGRGVR